MSPGMNQPRYLEPTRLREDYERISRFLGISNYTFSSVAQVRAAEAGYCLVSFECTEIWFRKVVENAGHIHYQFLDPEDYFPNPTIVAWRYGFALRMREYL